MGCAEALCIVGTRVWELCPAGEKHGGSDFETEWVDGEAEASARSAVMECATGACERGEPCMVRRFQGMVSNRRRKKGGPINDHGRLQSIFTAVPGVERGDVCRE